MKGVVQAPDGVARFRHGWRVLLEHIADGGKVGDAGDRCLGEEAALGAEPVVVEGVAVAVTMVANSRIPVPNTMHLALPLHAGGDLERPGTILPGAQLREQQQCRLVVALASPAPVAAVVVDGEGLAHPVNAGAHTLGARIAVVPIMVMLVAAAPDNHARVALELVHDGLRFLGQDAEETLRSRQFLAGQRELLHDHQPQLIGQLVEGVLLLQPATPDADQIDPRRMELAQEQFIALPGDAARTGIQRHPVHPFEEDRTVVDQQLQRNVLDPLPRTGHPVQGAQSDHTLMDAGLASWNAQFHAQRHAVGRAQAVRPPERGRRHFHRHGHAADVHQRQDAADASQLDHQFASRHRLAQVDADARIRPLLVAQRRGHIHRRDPQPIAHHEADLIPQPARLERRREVPAFAHAVACL